MCVLLNIGHESCKELMVVLYLSGLNMMVPRYVTDFLDFVWGNVDVALKLFPDALYFLFAPIEKKN